MLLNYIKSAHRNVMRNKVQSVVQIISLALGLSVFMLIAFYLYDEYTVDRSNPYKGEVYRVEELDNPRFGGDVVNFSLGQFILEHIPEISHLTRVRYNARVPLAYPESVDHPAAQTIVNSILVEPDFQHIFPQEYVVGSPEALFTGEPAIVLTESVARELFGDKNPLGEYVHQWLGQIPSKVVGVIKDPVNTHLKFEALTSFDSWSKLMRKKGFFTDPGTFYFPIPTYVRFRPDTDKQVLEEKLSQLWGAYSREIYDEVGEREVKVRFRPLLDVHYAAELDPTLDYMTVVSRRDLLNFLLFGIGILILGIINYINLSMARASQRGAEMAMRRVIGSSRPRLVTYLLTESLITTLIASLIALTLIQLLIHPFSKLVLADINLYFLTHPLTWILFLILILVLGILSGLYPALKMANRLVLHPAGWRSGQGKGVRFRSMLLVLQFTATGILLVGIFSMQHQINYMKVQELGFDTEQVYALGTGSMTKDDRAELYHKFKGIPGVEFVSYSRPLPGNLRSDDVVEVDNPSSIFHGLELRHMYTDLEFFDVFGLKFTHKAENLDELTIRPLTESSPTDSVKGFCIINESCRAALGIEDPIGYRTGNWGTIVGVVENFNLVSLRFPTKPLVIHLAILEWYQSIKLNSKHPSKILEQISEISAVSENNSWKPLPGIDHEMNRKAAITPIREMFNWQYEHEEHMRDASVYLSLLAAIIACLGLFGLSTFMVRRRTREIGIRKAMGSSERQIFWLLAKDFLKWVGLSVVIWIPLGWMIMLTWQKQFAYPAGFAWWIFGLPILIIFAVSFTTIAQQAYKTSRANPVDSLKTE